MAMSDCDGVVAGRTCELCRAELPDVWEADWWTDLCDLCRHNDAEFGYYRAAELGDAMWLRRGCGPMDWPNERCG